MKTEELYFELLDQLQGASEPAIQKEECMKVLNQWKSDRCTQQRINCAEEIEDEKTVPLQKMIEAIRDLVLNAPEPE